MSIDILTGGCYCGDIRYQIEGDILRSVTCRCTSCARTAGTHAIAWLTIPSDSIVLISGEPTRCTDGIITRTFCSRCGTKLTYRDDARSETDVTLSSIDPFHRTPSLIPASLESNHIVCHSDTG
jgi:hypothetical protein